MQGLSTKISTERDAVITSIVIAKNMQLLQTLYVVYRPSKNQKQTYMKVFQQTKRGIFSEKESSFANKYQLLEYSQPAFFDINGDMR